MLVTWGDDLLDTTQGLDVLGVRGIDQAVELSLVNGITTISQRARYFTILPWAIGEYLVGRASEGFDWGGFTAYLSRVEFLILAASRMDSELNGADASGALGANLHQERLAKLIDGVAVTFPDDSNGAMLGTYLAPCRTIGLLLDGDDTIPYRLSPRGKQILELRNERLRNSSAVEAILSGRDISRKQVEAAIPEFSLGSLAASKDEAELLYDALVTPWDSAIEFEQRRVAEAYEAINSTIEWANEMLISEPDTAAGLIIRNFNSCAQQADRVSVAYRWAEYEYRRRCHFALELVLSALTTSLRQFDEATIPQIVSDWFNTLETTPLLNELWPNASATQKASARKAVGSVPQHIFRDSSIPASELRQLPTAGQAFAAVALLAATAGQTKSTRSGGLFDLNSASPGERAITLIEDAGDESFSELMEKLVELTTLSHLQTTLRKMGAGQKCSLRFFPDGPLLRPTGISMAPGHSNDRLTNVLRIFTDIGRFERADGKFAPTNGGPAGEQILWSGYVAQ